ncbi:unnamed protein product [Gongylonema pulchrum]|uniref:ANF_receptor domain-containing protein n=1 Tax=Gongylonema pulchrum TaxID=637853 RepID=A0A183EHJ9_9BILA|nr:unnamed protein product [Gongylonema pulchrum]
MPEKTIYVPQTICEQLKERAIAVFGPGNFPGDIIAASYAANLTIPHFYLEPRKQIFDYVIERSVDLFPGPKVISDILVPIVIHYKWRSLVLLYQKASDLTNLQHFIAMSYFPQPYQMVLGAPCSGHMHKSVTN